MSIKKKSCDIFIIGCGAAGLSAALGAFRGGCRNLIAADSADSAGGILTRCAHRGFGVAEGPEPMTGNEYANHLLRQLPDFYPEFLFSTTVLEVTEDKTALAVSPDGLFEIEFKELIAALGSREIAPGELGIFGQHPKQIVTAGEIQEELNIFGTVPNGRSVILGAGDLGVIVAGQLYDLGIPPLCIVEKQAVSSAMARNYRHCIEATGIPVLYQSTVCSVSGSPDLESISVRHADGREAELACELLIVAAGLKPERSLISHLLNEEWLHLCGNCDKIYDIADTAAREAFRVGKLCAERIYHAGHV